MNASLLRHDVITQDQGEGDRFLAIILNHGFRFRNRFGRFNNEMLFKTVEILHHTVEHFSFVIHT
ncbi:Uncharacterised protein [Vibrio cholerae]|nr:Uncharacterised protein [Vibrio cholerae]CSB48503.1 Uncharacterised protein [Vibrio cholerae]CSC44813.1 Uncharacterised protein [Vibrio cholerae]CSI64686.1 Uncharacterised protein [Vibrio cholerae]